MGTGIGASERTLAERQSQMSHGWRSEWSGGFPVGNCGPRSGAAALPKHTLARNPVKSLRVGLGDL